MIFTLSGSIFLNLDTLSGSKITIVVLYEGKDLEIVYPFGSIIAEKDTRLGSKNGENDTLPSGTYPVPKISKCPPPGVRDCLEMNEMPLLLVTSSLQTFEFSKSVLFC